ncbi:GNAT family N-acetyltransferase [Pseudobowmanella zhangzhouensis]|uniref:GNAT family N-acetyltransferase n=1 Tax=Pseudobowmanella zhangzhouensis TaxID=1537679 RepID=UPI00366FE74B
MLTVRDAISADVEAITRIYNLGIASGTGTLDTHPREPAEIAAWLDKAARYPVLVIEQAGEVALCAPVRIPSARLLCLHRGIFHLSASRGTGQRFW